MPLLVCILISLLKFATCVQFDIPKYIPTEPCFIEDFESLQNWTFMDKKSDGSLYNGKWDLIKHPALNKTILQTQDENKLHGIKRKLPITLNNDFVLQFEVKFDYGGVGCCGGYIKLLPNITTNENDYTILFGPDLCGEDKLQFLVNYQGSHSVNNLKAKRGRITSLYTLRIKNNFFEIRINGDVIKAGNIAKELGFEEIIADKSIPKPLDWVDDEWILDLNSTKPLDWDENEPLMIKDPNVSKPLNWGGTELPILIPDPNISIPVDWDEDEDGKWETPMINNPECEIRGCGEWQHPLIENPNYKGPWIQPKIKNPNYTGPWQPRMLPNKLYQNFTLPEMNAIALDIWATKRGVSFDNIFIGHSIEEAERFGNESFLIKYEAEKVMYDALNQEYIEVASSNLKISQTGKLNIIETLILQIQTFVVELQMFVDEALDDPQVIFDNPFKIARFSIIILMITTFCMLICSTVVNFRQKNYFGGKKKRKDVKAYKID